MASLVEVQEKDAEGNVVRVRWKLRWREGPSQPERIFDDKKKATKAHGEAKRIERAEKDAARALGIRREELGRRESTFAQVAADWLCGIANASTRSANDVRLRVHILPRLGPRPIREIAASEIVRVINSWSTLAPSTRVSNYRTLATVFGAAEDDKIITAGENPCKTKTVRARTPRLPRGESADAWPEDWVEGVCRDIREDAAIFPYLGSFLGLRQGEAFGSGPEDFYVDAGGKRKMKVQRQVMLIGGHQFFGPPKHRKSGDTPREVEVPDFVWEKLTEYMDQYPPQKVTLPWDEGDGSPIENRTYELFMTTREGGAWNRNYFNTRVWKPLLTGLGIPPTRENGTHALRHWFACQFLRHNGGLTSLSNALGHHDRAYTLKVYGRHDPQSGALTAAAFESWGRSRLTP